MAKEKKRKKWQNQNRDKTMQKSGDNVDLNILFHHFFSNIIWEVLTKAIKQKGGKDIHIYIYTLGRKK